VEADRPGHAFSLSRLSLDRRICFGRRVFVLYQGTTLSRAERMERELGFSVCVRTTVTRSSPVGTAELAELSPGRSPGLAGAMEKSRRDD
jgi:hypothetical protein